MGWASRPSRKDGRDAHPTIIIKIVSYLICDPNSTTYRRGQERCTCFLKSAEAQLRTLNARSAEAQLRTSAQLRCYRM
ncbi:MAG: hypothetical protein EAZ49_11140 [Oscillatoriales cyanobacterium]|nr:MAG: hypothetical protein EAZ49_11140 [Oscillatoriales cyanobacterium]